MTLAGEIDHGADRAVSLLLGMHHHPGQYCAYLSEAICRWWSRCTTSSRRSCCCTSAKSDLRSATWLLRSATLDAQGRLFRPQRQGQIRHGQNHYLIGVTIQRRGRAPEFGRNSAKPPAAKPITMTPATTKGRKDEMAFFLRLVIFVGRRLLVVSITNDRATGTARG